MSQYMLCRDCHNNNNNYFYFFYFSSDYLFYFIHYYSSRGLLPGEGASVSLGFGSGCVGWRGRALLSPSHCSSGLCFSVSRGGFFGSSIGCERLFP
jgi:hypothetical protein